MRENDKIRGFEFVSGYEDVSKLPMRGTAHSGAYDFFSPEDITLKPGESYHLKTGIKSYMLPDEVLLVFIRSSLGKKDLELRNKVPVIDSDYYNNPDNEGNVILMLRNTNLEGCNVEIKRGEKVAQGMFVKYLLADGDGFDVHGIVRSGGIGSTGV
jgi:dUTP pyrophosphatase